jgi:hypothetical protein
MCDFVQNLFTSTHLMHPWPTADMGQDQGGVLPLIQSKEVRDNVLFGLEQ